MKSCITIGVARFAAVCVTMAAVAQGPALAEGTVMLAPGATCVVIPKDAVPVAKFAASELTNFLSRVLGAPVPIANEPAAVGVSVLVGDSEWSRTAGIDAAAIGQDAFRIKAEGNRVFIVGRDDPKWDPAAWLRGKGGLWHMQFNRGTINGAYSFLERHAGVGFYFIGDLGTVVPSVGRVELPCGDVTTAPDFLERNWSYHREGAPYEGLIDPGLSQKDADREWSRLRRLNMLRLRVGIQSISQKCHGLRAFRIAHRFRDTHPEYFRMNKDGTRYLYDSEKPPHYKNGKLCFSNPGLRNEIYADIKAYLTGQPASSRGLDKWSSWAFLPEKTVSIGPEDGYSECFCPGCQAQYDRSTPAFLSKLFWGFYIDMASRLKADGIEGTLMVAGSSGRCDLLGDPVPNNIITRASATGAWSIRKPKELEGQLARIARIKSITGNKVPLWTYAGKFSCLRFDLPDIPDMTPRAHIAFYKRAAPLLMGSYDESQSDRYLFEALNHYAYSKVTWDTHLDGDALLSGAYRQLFGAAAAHMQKFFERLEDLWLDKVCGKTVATSIGPVNLTPSEFEIWTSIYSAAFIKEMGGLMSAAAGAVAPDSAEARRVALFRTEIYDRLRRHQKEYSESLSVEREKASRASRKPVNLVEGFKPVTVTVDATMTNKPFHCAKFQVPLMKKGHRYRASYFARGENVVPYARRGGVQGIAWWDEAADTGRSFPRAGVIGTFDWVHFEKEFDVPEKVKDFKPEFDLRILYATGTAHFDGLLVEEIK